MKMLVLMTTLLSGLCTLSSCLPHQYYLVNIPKTWTEAQRYCREKYTDLATIDNMEDMNQLIKIADMNNITSPDRAVWIGLYDDISSWRWSLEDSRYYGEGQAEFRNWRVDQPTNEDTELCAMIGHLSQWIDSPCSDRRPFICNQGAAFVYINQEMTWTEAQSYCRQHHTDLASVRNQTENQQIEDMDIQPADALAWIGLYRDSWKWSHGSKSTFRNWKLTEPQNNFQNEFCVASEFANAGAWADWPCNWTFPFICYISRVQQVVRMRLTRENSGVDLEDPAVMKAILQQVQVKLREKGLTEDFQLRWRKQTDGKVFHKEEEESSQRKKRECVPPSD